MMIVSMFVVLIGCLYFGLKKGGMALGPIGGLGLFVLTLFCGVTPSNPPVSILLMILSVVLAASSLEAAGGMDLLIYYSDKLLRSKPRYLTYLAPLVCFFLTFFSGTGHVVYTMLPIISKLAASNGVRPARPLSISVIASQQAITAGPLSAATLAFSGLLTQYEIGLFDILKITLPATLLAIVITSWIIEKLDQLNLNKNQQWNKLAFQEMGIKSSSVNRPENFKQARLGLIIFLLGIFYILLIGPFPKLAPPFQLPWIEKSAQALEMSTMVQLVMMVVCASTILFARVTPKKIMDCSVMKAGMSAMIAIFGLAWLGDSVIQHNLELFQGSVQTYVTQYPSLFSLALFISSIFLFSQAATTRAIMPIGLALGIPPQLLVAFYPAVNGYFFVPNYPTILAAIEFDTTGSTKVGKYIFNHSFMLPGLICTVLSISISLLLCRI